jgi:putative tryptophan/tyrosine transport system substrate-binding protein
MRRRALLMASLGWAVGQSSSLAQGSHEVRRVGIIMPYSQSDPDIQSRVGAFHEEMRRLGLLQGKNIIIEERWSTEDIHALRGAAAEAVAGRPNAILIASGRLAAVMHEATSDIPIVFMETSDPVQRGLVSSLARPSGNMTGFALTAYPLVEKQLDFLKQIAPSVVRVLVMFNPDNPNTAVIEEAMRAAADRLRVTPVFAPVRGVEDIEGQIDRHLQGSGDGALFPTDATTFAHRNVVIAAMARRGKPAVYASRAMAVAGGLVSYSADQKEVIRRSAAYIDRILRGERPGDLPVQQPTRYELVLNLQTAKALNLTIPPTLLARADEVIE